jgi:hypothetical protein
MSIPYPEPPKLRNTGLIDNYLIKQNTIISHNECARYFNTESRDAWNKESPIGINTRTNLWLTQEGYHCTDFSKSFIVGEISGEAEIDADFDAHYGWGSGPITQPTTPEIFIGYKNAAEIFVQYELYNNRQKIGCQTNEAIREGFINSCFFAKEEKENNRFAHTLWESLQKGDNSYYGVKIPLKRFHEAPNRKVHFSFPFNNILPLQAIDQNCQEVFCNMHFEAYWNPKGMVCAPIDLKVTYKDSYLETLKPTDTTQWAWDLANQTWIMNLSDENSCTHELTQIVQPFIMDAGWDYGDGSQQPTTMTYQWNLVVKPYPCRGHVSNYVLHLLQSVMQCYYLLDPAIDTVRDYFVNHIAIWGTQWIKFENLPAAPTQAGLNTSVTTSLWNTTDIMLLCPRTGDDYTIYKNIMYENIILKVCNRTYQTFLFRQLEQYS